MIVLDGFARFGRFLGDVLCELADFARFAMATMWGIVIGRRAWGRWSRLGRQLYRIGVTSVPVLVLTGGVTGAILAIEGYDQFAAFGQEDRLGMVVNLSILKQIGPLLAAVMLAGRVGCALAAELGSMRVTEQIDAMRVMGANPVHVLVDPRLVACVVMIPTLTIVSNVFGVLGGWLVTTKFYGVDGLRFWWFSANFIDWYDIFTGIFKSVFFGAAIALVACWKGFTCRKGAQGVGRATTESFVLSFVAIVVLNLVLAKVLNDIDALRMAALR